SRGRCGVVRGIPMQTTSSGSARRADRLSIARRSASAWATEGGPAKTAEVVSSSGSERSNRARAGAGTSRKSRANRERATRDAAGSAELDQLRILHVVDDDLAPEPECDVRRDELLELAAARLPREPRRDDERLALDRDARLPQGVECGAERLAPRIVVRAWNR